MIQQTPSSRLFSLSKASFTTQIKIYTNSTPGNFFKLISVNIRIYYKIIHVSLKNFVHSKIVVGRFVLKDIRFL